MFFLFLLFARDEVLVLNNGATLACLSWSRSEGFVVFEREADLFSLPERLVDWERTQAYKTTLEEPATTPAEVIDGPEPFASNAKMAEKEWVIAMIDVRRTSLIDLIRFLADTADVNLYIDSSVVDSKVTYRLHNVPWQTVLRMVCLNAGLDYDVIGGTLLVRGR